jgi:hypothetical protein
MEWVEWPMVKRTLSATSLSYRRAGSRSFDFPFAALRVRSG